MPTEFEIRALDEKLEPVAVNKTDVHKALSSDSLQISASADLIVTKFDKMFEGKRFTLQCKVIEDQPDQHRSKIILSVYDNDEKKFITPPQTDLIRSVACMNAEYEKYLDGLKNFLDAKGSETSAG